MVFFTARQPRAVSTLGTSRPIRSAIGFFAARAPKTRVVWYFTEPGAKELPFPTIWASTVWSDIYELAAQNIGERPRAGSATWASGIAPKGATGQHYCGTPADFQEPKVWDPHAPLPRLGFSGLPACCARVTTAAIGFTGGRGRYPIGLTVPFEAENALFGLGDDAVESVFALGGEPMESNGLFGLGSEPLESGDGLGLGGEPMDADDGLGLGGEPMDADDGGLGFTDVVIEPDFGLGGEPMDAEGLFGLGGEPVEGDDALGVGSEPMDAGDGLGVGGEPMDAGDDELGLGDDAIESEIGLGGEPLEAGDGMGLGGEPLEVGDDSLDIGGEPIDAEGPLELGGEPVTASDGVGLDADERIPITGGITCATAATIDLGKSYIMTTSTTNGYWFKVNSPPSLPSPYTFTDSWTGAMFPGTAWQGICVHQTFLGALNNTHTPSTFSSVTTAGYSNDIYILIGQASGSGFDYEFKLTSP